MTLEEQATEVARAYRFMALMRRIYGPQSEEHDMAQRYVDHLVEEIEARQVEEERLAA